MEIQEVNRKIYDESIKRFNEIFYNSSDFVELNKDKVDSIKYLIAYNDNSPRFAFPFGIKDNIAKAPFSAPFSLPIVLKKDTSIKHYEEVLIYLEKYLKNINIRKIKFILPPIFYNNKELTGWINAFYNLNYKVINVDVNHALNLKKAYTDKYIENIEYDARRNLKIALKKDLNLIPCLDEQNTKEAYNIISDNRASKGYPLRMTYKQVSETIKIVQHNIFIVNSEGKNIAAALIYRVTPKIVQVIYWGDRPGFNNLKSINYLSYQLIQHYGRESFDYVDIGPSTEESVPNFGLCDFKESIGCERGLKFTFEKEL